MELSIKDTYLGCSALRMFFSPYFLQWKRSFSGASVSISLLHNKMEEELNAISLHNLVQKVLSNHEI
jgi:hypothetical protein